MNPPRILVVDDALDLLDLFSTWLQQAGYEVLQATRADECLRIVKEKLPDLVLLDVMLPDLNGIDVCKQIKSDRNTAGVLVIHISGMRTSADHEAEGLEAGADGYLTKPVEPRTLLAQVNALLRVKRTEEALKQRESQFRAAFDNALDAMLIADDQANYVDANPAACALFGVPRDEMLKRNLLDFVEPGQRRATEKAWQTFIKEGEQRGDFRLYRPDGTTRELEYRAKASFLPSRHLSVLRDVTERKQAEEALREAHDELEKRVEQRTAELLAANRFLKNEIGERKRAEEALRKTKETLETIFDAAPVAILGLDLEGRITNWSSGAQQMFGWSAEETIGRLCPTVPEDGLADFKAMIDLVVREGPHTGMVYVRQKKNRERIHCSISSAPLRDTAGKVTGVMVILEDITELKQHQEELRRSEEQYRELVENINDILYATDEQGVITYISQVIENSTGLSPSEIIGHPFAEFIHPEDLPSVIESFQQSASGHSTPSEFRIFDQSGKTHWLRKSSRPVFHGNRFAGTRGLLTDITERKRSEQNLRESEERFRATFEKARAGMVTTDLKGRFLQVNPAFCTFLGFSEDELLKLTVRDVTHPDDQGETERQFREVAAGAREVIDLEKKYVRKDGATVWGNTTAAFLFDLESRPTYCVAVIQDVTERKWAEEALRSTNQMLQTLIYSSPLAIVVQERDGNVSLWNPAAEQMLGWTEAEILGHPNPIVPNEKEALRQEVMVGRAVTGLEKIRHRKDGSPIYLSSSVAPTIGADGSSIGTVTIMADITEGKQAEEALRATNQTLRTLIYASPLAIVGLDPEGNVEMWNPAAERIFGWSEEEVLGNFLPFIPEDKYEEFCALREVVLQGGVSTGVELCRRKKDGSPIYISLSTAPIRDAEGNITGIIGIMADITERKRVEEERAQLLRRLVTAQEEEQRRLSRELHDQMGQSIAALMLGLKSLDGSVHLQSSENDRLHQLQGLTNQLARDVHHLASSLRPTALDDLGLDTALSNYVEEWAERSKIAVDFHSNGLLKHRLPPQVETTVYRIVQEALTNVLKHAQARNVSIIVANRRNRVVAIVEDNGCGFDIEAMMNKPISERRLGLLGMKERVSLVGGDLDIESTPGAGTTVRVHIPI